MYKVYFLIIIWSSCIQKNINQLIINYDFRRASSTGSIDGVCAVVNMSSGVLEGSVCGALKKALRQGYPCGYLDLAQAYTAIHTTIQQGRLQPGDTETQKALFLVNISIEYDFIWRTYEITKFILGPFEQ